MTHILRPSRLRVTDVWTPITGQGSLPVSASQSPPTVPDDGLFQHDGASSHLPRACEDRSSPFSERQPDSLGHINEHTEGDEFYGPSGTFYFLARLRAKAKRQKKSLAGDYGLPQSSSRCRIDETSVINLLHNVDYSRPASADIQLPRDNDIPRVSRHAVPGRDISHKSERQSSRREVSYQYEVERECVRLYFQNLHYIHPILDPSAFMLRCEKELWYHEPCAEDTAPPLLRKRARFLSLFNIVLALGAVTAGETSMLTSERTMEFLAGSGQLKEIQANRLPIQVARNSFEKSKSYLEDIYESSSVETAQTLLLMSIFCQNALKPHSCYMYNGMAIRSTLAMGIPTVVQPDTSEKSLLWWALYSHEIEMCYWAGRPSVLRNPSSYSIPFPIQSQPSPRDIVKCMVDLAKVAMRISENMSCTKDRALRRNQSEVAFDIVKSLVDWKAGLPVHLDFTISSLEESDWMMKQKTVLKLRKVMHLLE